MVMYILHEPNYLPQIRKELIEEVDYGSFKQEVDHGLELRKAGALAACPFLITDLLA